MWRRLRHAEGDDAVEGVVRGPGSDPQLLPDVQPARAGRAGASPDGGGGAGGEL